MNKKNVGIFLTLVFLLIACKQDNVTPQMPKTGVNQVQTQNKLVNVPVFKIPETPLIDSVKAIQYKKASLALLALGEQWSETLEKASNEERVQILEAYEKARDQVCAKAGLAGIAEFLWVTEFAIPFPDNRAVLQTAGVSLP